MRRNIVGGGTMGKFNFVKTEFPGLIVVEPTAFGDERGFFMESYNYRDFKENGIDMEFIQDNHSRSKKGVLRGLHFQTRHTQAKLVRVIRGRVFDVVVDLRKGSPTYGKAFGIILDGESKRELFVPEGFAHGFVVLEDDTDFTYKVSDYWDPESEGGIRWNDPELNIKWPLNEYSIKEPIINKRDASWPLLSEFDSPFLFTP